MSNPAAAEKTFVAGEGIRKAVSSESRTAGGIIDRLDSYAVDIGSTHVSAWDALAVVLIVIGVIFFGKLAIRSAGVVIRRVKRLDETQRVLADKIAGIVIWTLAILIGIDLLGIDLTALAVFSGALGLAVGIGLQKTFGNLIAGIILLMDRSIKPGDVIAVASVGGGPAAVGQVKKIGIRAVSVTTRDNIEFLIPNENLMVNQVENWSFSSRDVRIKVPVSVAYGADLDLAEELMLQAAHETPRVSEVPAPAVWLSSFGDNAIQFEIQAWIDDPEEGVGNVRSDVLKILWRLFHKHGIAVPFPQRDLNLRDSEVTRALVEALRGRGKDD